MPLPFKSWVVDPSAQRDELLAMLETLQALHVELDVKRSYAAVGSVVKAVVDAVKAEGISARLLVLSSTLTTGGRGGLRTREAAGHYGKAQEQEMLRPTPDDSACVLPPPPRAIQRRPLFLRSSSALFFCALLPRSSLRRDARSAPRRRTGVATRAPLRIPHRCVPSVRPLSPPQLHVLRCTRG